MISIIITSFKEPTTIGKAIEAFLSQKLSNYELIVSAPDKETLDVAKKYAKNNKKIKVIKDPGRGKPSALNLAFKKAKGNFLVLSDGDVFCSKNSVESLMSYFKDSKTGGISAKVVSINKDNTLFGFWAEFLTKSFHNLRLRQSKQGKNIVCSGYLYAVRKNLVTSLPENTLADDAYITSIINDRGYKTDYAPSAEVYVKYPTNLKDWIKQKKRTAARVYQFSNKNSSKIDNFKEELLASLISLKEITSFKKFVWFIFLILMRSYIWFRVFFDFRLWKRDFNKVWSRVESTKQQQ